MECGTVSELLILLPGSETSELAVSQACRTTGQTLQESRQWQELVFPLLTDSGQSWSFPSSPLTSAPAARSWQRSRPDRLCVTV